MGKTCLLANIAHQIMRDDDGHMTLIRFIVLQEFVQALSNTRINIESIIKTIAEQSSNYEFGRKFVEHVLKSKPCVLLFDGFDEVLSDHISNAKQILRETAKLPHIRIFVATRRHLQDELESTLEVLSHTIRPFALSNQISFLCKFWEMKGAVPNESLSRFTEECIKQLTSKMTDSERSITGIPLQCRMLAETYEDDAIRCSKTGYHLYDNSDSISLITSVFEMYEKHINMRFHSCIKVNQLNYKVIKNVHMYHALKLLFPDHAIKFKKLNKYSIPAHQLCGLGLVESTHSNDIRFVHRTFAEFLVAWFVFENISTSSMHQTFVFSNIFQTLYFTQKLPVGEYGSVFVASFWFTFPVICYFVNGFSRNEHLINITSSHYLKEELPICAASAYHNYSNLPYIVRSCIRFPFIKNIIQRAKTSDIGNLLLIAARYSSLELMKVLYLNIDIASVPFLEHFNNSNLGLIKIFPLHIAVMRGDYNVVKYLLTLFENKLGEHHCLVHLCVSNSRLDPDYIVDEKIDIIKLLLEKNKKCINEKTSDQITPIMQSNVNSRLMVFLTQAGADLDIINESGQSVLDNIIQSTMLAPELLHEIVESASKHGFQYFNKRYRQGATPLHRAMEKSELLIATLKLFQSNNADLNAVDYENNSVLFYAIRGGRSAMFIKELIHLGADWEHINDDLQNAIHVSAKYGNVDAIKYFVDAYNMDVNVQDINLNTPLHLAVAIKSEKQVAMIGFLINNGANVNLRNDKRQIPLIAAFVVGNGLSVNAMIQMEQKGLYITSTLASQALKAAFFKHHQRELLTSLSNDSIQYLIKKGGQIFYDLKENFWKLMEVPKHMPVMIRSTKISSALLSAAKEHGLLTDQDYERLQNSQEELQSDCFYQIVQEKSFPVERMYLILRNHKQLRALAYLQMCMEDCQRRLVPNMFLIPHPRLMEYTQSITTHMIVLKTNCVELSVRKIQETIDENAVVLEKHDLVLMSELKLSPALIILKCEIVTDELINEVISLRNKWNKLVLICSKVNSSIASAECEIVTDHHSWDDITSHYKDILLFKFENTVYNIDELFVTPKILKVIGKLNMVCKIPQSIVRNGELNNSNYRNMFRIIGYKVGHLTKKCDDIYLSSKLFHYIFPDKFVFVNITQEKLRTLAKYGQKIGVFGMDTNYCDYDYIIVQHTYQFEEICKGAGTGLNIHLVDYKECLFKLVRTMGYAANIRRFFEKTSLCESFPFCSCEVVDATIIQFSIVDENEDMGLQRVYEISTDDIFPEARQILGLQQSIDLFEFRRCYKNIQQQTSQLNHPFVDGQLQHDSQVPELVNIFFTCLAFPDNEMHLLKKVAVNAIFPHVNGIIEISGLEKYVNMKLLSCKGDSFVFVHEAWACYLIADSLVNQKPDEAFTSFYKFTIDHIDYVRNSLLIISKDRLINTFKFNNSWLFRFIDFFASKLNNSDSFTGLIAKCMSTETIFKWIHACINDNLFNLLKILVVIWENEIFFKSTDLVMLAVRYGSVTMIEMVLKKYNKQTILSSKGIKQEPVKNTTDHSQSVIFPAFLVAASRGNYSVVEYLLNKFFQDVFINQLPAVLRATIVDTHMNDFNDIKDRKRILEYLFQNQPSLIEETNKASKSLLFDTTIHIDLIICLINLGINTQATNQGSDNMLHFCSAYLTPQQYEMLVKTLYEMGETKIFHALNKYQETPLFMAVEHLELLDSTIDIFFSIGVDFNAVNEWDQTVLRNSVVSHRSAHFLDTLIKAGADPKKLDNHKRTTLHAAVIKDNLSALRYFILVGSDVNARDKRGSTPLHLALNLSKTYTYEIVKVLVNHGADVKARNKYNKSILDYAIERKSCESKDILVAFLQKNGA
ncbi:unnamed protein product [Orchesella dallaii]|uniref:Uncharacterized protein n=1 Tax=Orchesella dallaii TaxID=48710 RepID=A0ABP1R6S2_9HEXA